MKNVILKFRYNELTPLKIFDLKIRYKLYDTSKVHKPANGTVDLNGGAVYRDSIIDKGIL